MTSPATKIVGGVPRDDAGNPVPPSLHTLILATWYLRDGSYLTLKGGRWTRTATELYRDGTIGTLSIPLTDGPIVPNYYHDRVDKAAIAGVMEKLSLTYWSRESGQVEAAADPPADPAVDATDE
jgi:hypothetical protein